VHSLIVTFNEETLGPHNFKKADSTCQLLYIPVLDLPVSDLPVFDLPVLDLPVLDLPALDLPVFGFASLVEI
jgi:hypothetical protein